MEVRVIDKETILASGVYVSKKVSIPQNLAHFALYWTVTGSGTVKFECETSADGDVFVEDTTDITTGQTAGSSCTNFSPVPCKWIKIKCTETGTSDAAVVTADLVVK